MDDRNETLTGSPSPAVDMSNSLFTKASPSISDFLLGVLSELRMKVREASEPPAQSPKTPAFAMVREIDLTADAASIKLQYTRGWDGIDIAAEGRIEDVLKIAASGNFTFQTGAATTNLQPVSPFSNALSLNNRDLHYVIFLLKDGKNWQFSRFKSPITIANKSNNKRAYFSALRVKKDGTVISSNLQVQDGCPVAYMIADAEAAGEGYSDYVDRINLHVDLTDSLASPKYFTPLIIDPDIRHPGGSGA